MLLKLYFTQNTQTNGPTSQKKANKHQRKKKKKGKNPAIGFPLNSL